MKLPVLTRWLLASSACALLLAACGGGGGGGGGGDGPPPSAYGRSADFAGVCTLETQKKFVRAYMDEVYLWYDEIPEVDAARFSNVGDYFNALRVTTPDANGLPKDQWSTVLDPAGRAVQQSFDTPPQASLADLQSSHTNAVTATSVLPSPVLGRRTGYIQFDDQDAGAQDDLIAAFRQIERAGVQDLVLDLRQNAGGFLYVALAAASMITGPGSEGEIFEELRYSDKRPADTAEGIMRFSSQLQFADSRPGSPHYGVGTALPQLNLPRVFVLTTGLTCSASESIINGLRGIGMEVVRIGTTTCGKPYGFREKDNCGYRYFAIEFQGYNAQGFGDFTAGFTPTCEVANGGVRGTDSDTLLTAAFHYIDQGSCPAGSATGILSAAAPASSTAARLRPFGRSLLAPAPR